MTPRLTVTRKRITKLLNPDRIRAIMDGDIDTIIAYMPLFIADQNDYVGYKAGRAYIGSLVLKDFAVTMEQFKNDIAVTPRERQLIQLSIEKRTPTAPGWMRVLGAASDWGQLPWVVANDDQKGLWFRRYDIVKDIEAKASRK